MQLAEAAQHSTAQHSTAPHLGANTVSWALGSCSSPHRPAASTAAAKAAAQGTGRHGGACSRRRSRDTCRAVHRQSARLEGGTCFANGNQCKHSLERSAVPRTMSARVPPGAAAGSGAGAGTVAAATGAGRVVAVGAAARVGSWPGAWAGAVGSWAGVGATMAEMKPAGEA
jgi:hypothetical protein